MVIGVWRHRWGKIMRALAVSASWMETFCTPEHRRSPIWEVLILELNLCTFIYRGTIIILILTSRRMIYKIMFGRSSSRCHNKLACMPLLFFLVIRSFSFQGQALDSI